MEDNSTETETIDKISKQDDNASCCSEDTLISHGSSIRSSKRRAHGSNGSSSPRKCSFKTHAKNTYVPRKMTSNVSGRVAALTEKFNKIIEKDMNFLNEVKRNNGVLLSRAGHVYKIVEDKKQTTSTALVVTPPSPPQPPLQPPPQAPEQAMENNASPKHATVNNSVKETIKIFENLKAPTKVPPNRSTFKLDLILNSQELEKIDEVLTPVKDEGSLIAEDMHFDDETDKKILEAIDLVENKIAFLSKEHYDEEFKREEAEEVAVAKEVVEPVYAPLNPKPNESFLHSTKITSIPIIEAVNSSLIARKHIYDDENGSNNGYSPIIYKEICNTYEYIKTAPTATDNDDAPETAEIIASACKDDIYEVCESKEKISQRTTTDELPPLPEPKRKTAPQEVARELPKIPSNCGAVDDLYDLGGEIEMEENIYATIRGYDGDNMSVISHNGYESIGGYQKIKKSPSISTISSDLKANSLYGVSMVPMVDGGESSDSIGKTVPIITINNVSHQMTDTCNGEIDDSDDDEWIEISDQEDATSEARNKFVVVRERVKRKGSVWSKKLKEKRLQREKVVIDDDSDHYYETLSPMMLDGNNGTAEDQKPETFVSELMATLDEVNSNSSNVMKKTSKDNELSEDYDSFSDEEADVDMSKNDSGVDMSNIKLPELPGPPTPTSNLYSTLKKLKNFVTNKKSPKSKNKTYESTQFYVPSSTSASTPQLNLQSPDSDPNNCYENVNFETSKSTEKIKPKESNRIKSKLRKSLVIFDSNSNLSSPSEGKSTFYTTGSESSQNLTSNESIIPKKFPTLVKKNKNSKTQRRKTSTDISVPSLDEPIYANKMKSSTSWYTECGVFKESLPNITVTPTMSEERSSNGHTSWYAEAGLYQSNGSPSSSADSSSGISTSGDANSYENAQNVFPNEPLYQIYNAAKVESITRDMEDERNSSSFDGYEEIGGGINNNNAPPVPPMRRKSRPTALQLVSPKSGPSRTLWSEIPEVKSSQILLTLTANERKVQEAKFEIVTSEASYLKSLNLLRSHFMNHPALRDSSVLSSSDRKKLFGLISPVIECSNAFLKALENCWQENIMLLDISKIIYESADKHFHVYIKFCEHQAEMDRTLRRLKENKNGVFNKTLEVLESDATCCGLTLHSFLMLPMQRITRLPLLVDAVFSKIHYASDEHECWKMTLAMLNKFAQQCNDAATKCEQAYEMQRLSSQIEFPSHIAPIPINPTGILSPGTKPRYVVKTGELLHVVCRGDDAKRTLRKKFPKSQIYVFLFSDLLVLTKKKTDEQYSVFDYCARSLITISSGEEMLQHLNTGKDTTLIGKNLILLTLLENHEKKTVEMYLSCKTVSEQQRWLQAINPSRESEIPGEKLYEDWDCPQVTVKHEYSSTEPDALNLEPGDIVNVFRKLPDGWYHGERIRDGACGWFPGSYTEEINQLHVRSRNLKQRHRLLTFTAAYLDSQKKQIARVS